MPSIEYENLSKQDRQVPNCLMKSRGADHMTYFEPPTLSSCLCQWFVHVRQSHALICKVHAFGVSKFRVAF